MIIQIGGGHTGVAEYDITGAKKGRKQTRDELDERVVLSGDLDTTKRIYESIPTKGERYKHITLSFKETEVSIEDLQKASDTFETFLRAAYTKDELNIFSVAHIPKIKTYKTKNGEIVIRKPHIHFFVPNLNLLTNEQIMPLGLVKYNIHHIDAFQELFNQKNGFTSPKLNRVEKLNTQSEIMNRNSDELFIRNKSEKQEILSYIIDNDISNYKDFEEYLKSNGTVRTRNKNKQNEYLNVKLAHQSQGINLKEFVFSKEFLSYTKEQKLEFLNKELDLKFIEKQERYETELTDKYIQDLKAWTNYKAKEIKYIDYKSTFYKDEYKNYSDKQKKECVEKLELEFYKKHDIEQEIKNEIKNVQSPGIIKIDNSQKLFNSSIVLSKIQEHENNIFFKNYKFKKDNSKIIQILNSKKGVNNETYIYNEHKQTIKAGSQEHDMKSFIKNIMHYNKNDVIALEQKILELEQQLKNKEQIMNLKINIKQSPNSMKVEHFQMGKEDAAKRFTGIVFDHASKVDTAKAYIINDKVVSKEHFEKAQKEMAIQIDAKQKELFNINKTTKHNAHYRCDVVNERHSLTAKGLTYANSRYNFKEMKSIEMGITKIPNSKKIDKNFFTIAKDFLTAKHTRDEIKVKFHDFKQKVKAIITSKPELAASNIALTHQLHEMKHELERVKSLQMAEKIVSQHEQQVEKKTIDVKLEQYNVLNAANEKLNSQPLSQEEAQKLQQNLENDGQNARIENVNNQEQKEEMSFKDMIFKVKDIYDKTQDVAELAQKLPDFIDAIKDEKNQTLAKEVVELFEHARLDNINPNIANEVIKSQDPQLVSSANMMTNNGLKTDSFEQIKSFANTVNEAINQSASQNMNVDTVISNVISALQKAQEQQQHQGQEQGY